MSNFILTKTTKKKRLDWSIICLKLVTKHNKRDHSLALSHLNPTLSLKHILNISMGKLYPLWDDKEIINPIKH